MPSRATAAKLPKAYEEDHRSTARPAAGPEHFINLEGAQPSPIMIGFQRLWRGLIGFARLALILAIIGAYPAAVFTSSKIYDDPVVFPQGETWAVPGVGVAIHKVGRELKGAGIVSDRASWHPQARLTALPAWQDATFAALSEYAKLLSVAAAKPAGPDNELEVASNLLAVVPGEPMAPRIAMAGEALNRYDTQANRGSAMRPMPEDTLPMEMAMFARWAAADRAALSDRINAEQDVWLASREDISAFYAAKARAHLAHELILTTKARAYNITGDTELAVALARAESAWRRAAELKPFFVSNRSGSGALLPNHLSSMAYYLTEAEEASAHLAAKLAPPPPPEVAVGEVAQTGEEPQLP